MSLFGVTRQTKGCVLCGEIEKKKDHSGAFFLPQGTQGNTESGKTLYLNLSEHQVARAPQGGPRHADLVRDGR